MNNKYECNPMPPCPCQHECECKCKCYCKTGFDFTPLNIAISLLLAAGVALLFFFDLLPFIFVGAGFSLFFSFAAMVLLAVSFFKGKTECTQVIEGTLTRCLCKYKLQLFIGAIATMLFSLLTLCFIIFIFPIAGAIIVGLTAFFFFFLIFSIVQFLNCMVFCKRC